MPPKTSQNTKSRSGLEVNMFKQNFEKQIGGGDKKELYEYDVPDAAQSGDQKINVRAFRKYGFGGVGTFYTHVTQFPFRGHDQWAIEDAPANK